MALVGGAGERGFPLPAAVGWWRDVRTWLLMLLLAGATTAAFWPCLRSTLMDEDLGLPAGASPDGLGPRQLWWMVTGVRGGGYQPLTWATLCGDYAGWRLDPRGSHAVNLGLHVLNTLLVYALTLSLLAAAGSAAQKARFSGAEYAGAFLAALLFGLHPLRVEPVTWVAQRGILLSTCLSLLTALFCLRAWASASLRYMAAAVICYALALTAGLWAVTLPLVLVLLDGYPLRRFAALAAPKEHRPTLLRALLEKKEFLLLACAALALDFGIRGHAAPGVAGGDIAARLVLTAYGFVFYLWKTLWPGHLLPIYELSQPLKLLMPAYIGAVVALVAAVVGLVCVARRVPALAVAALSYLLLLLPAVVLIQSGDEAAGDRYSYLASVPWLLVLGAGLVRLWGRPGLEARFVAIASVVVGLAAAGALGALTWRQCQVWRSPLALWTYADKLAPRSGLVAYHLAGQFERVGECARAVQLYEAVVQERPALLAARRDLGNVLMQELNFQEAIKVYRQMLALAPRDADAHFRLGAALAAAGEFAVAEEQLRQAVVLAPGDVRSRRSLGHLYMLLNRPEDAADAFRAALRVAPHDADLYYNLGRACLRAGWSAEAAEAFRHALQEDPTHKLARHGLDQPAAQPTSWPAAPE